VTIFETLPKFVNFQIWHINSIIELCIYGVEDTNVIKGALAPPLQRAAEHPTMMASRQSESM
jgi:hypothetical protein